MKRSPKARPGIHTVIRIGSAHRELTCEDPTTGESHTLDFTKADRHEMRQLSSIICGLHGIKDAKGKRKGRRHV